MAGSGRLKAAVYVKDPVTYEDLILLPGESPPPEIAELVTNPDAWDTPPRDGAAPEPIAVVEPNSNGGTAEPAKEQNGAAVADTKKAPARRSRPSAA